MNTFDYRLPASIHEALTTEVAAWQAADKITRIWNKDASIWTGDDEAKWLGWLDIVDEELADLAKYRELTADIDGAGLTDVLLMGMGGSSLCPEVLAITFGKTHFHILDSTVPAQVKTVENKLDLERTLFIVASKSGSTLEPNCFKQYFFELLATRVGREQAGKQFIAITDPGSKMEQVARDDGFRHIFYGKPEIGGRFSALSAFGMVAAASMGLDVEQFLKETKSMIEACRNPLQKPTRSKGTDAEDSPSNPAALLGLILGICHRHGRDKLTIFTSPEIYDLGAWMEQLVAESTGKNGVAIIPVDREPVLSSSFSLSDVYGDDRLFAYITLTGDDRFADDARELVAAGHPVIQIETPATDTLGQEFFRWEFATAVAGAVMGINPFNQPDVESAKIEARKITDEYEQSGKLPDESPFFEGDGLSFFASDQYAADLTATVSEPTATAILNAHLDNIEPNDYFALLAFIEMTAEHESLLQAFREKVLDSHRVATCLGFGPRFLHSTGQAYKGGANNGVFLQITSDDSADLPVPGQKYTFGVVKAAQARGDLQVLIDRGRRVLRVHIGAKVEAGLQRLLSLI
ncbi:MAG: bifunctional transaldolase/phosoglucose isomerase [Chloracidobacterium sp.]|nr:bifunctional transaldolase/phosoglucose isomerase [Chloracidobacterium sp.]